MSAYLAGYTTDELLTRTNLWAQNHSLAPVTRASLLAWRQAGLVPPPRFQSLGRGHGSAQRWPADSYRRLLQINRLRGQGASSHRAQRLHLWLMGNSISLQLIRTDLAETFGLMIRTSRTDLGAPAWGASPSSNYPTARRTARMTKALAANLPSQASTALVPWGPEPSPLPIGEALNRIGALDLLRGWMHHLLVPTPDAFRMALDRSVAHLPEAWRVMVPEGLLDILVAGVGLLADPDDGRQPLLDSLNACPDQALLSLRDAVNGWNDLWRGLFLLTRALVAQDAVTASGAGSRIASFLSPLLSYLAELTPIPSSESAVSLLAWLLLLRDRNAFDGTRLGLFTKQRGGRRLFGWIALHLEELQSAARTSPGSLVGVPAVLPAEQQSLWRIAYPE
jgi:hypothetical protein